MLTPNDLNKELGKVIEVENQKIDHLQSAKDYLQLAIFGFGKVEDASGRERTEHWLKLAEVYALISIATDMRHPVVMGERAGRPGLSWHEIQQNDGSWPGLESLLPSVQEDFKAALEILYRMPPSLCDCDECHRIENERSGLMEKYKHLLRQTAKPRNSD